MKWLTAKTKVRWDRLGMLAMFAFGLVPRNAIARSCSCDAPEVTQAFTRLTQQVADLGVRDAIRAQAGEAEELLYENLKLRLALQRQVPRECFPTLFAKAGGAGAGALAVQLKFSSPLAQNPREILASGNSYSSKTLLDIYRKLSGDAFATCANLSGIELELCRAVAEKVAARVRTDAMRSASSPELAPFGLAESEFRALRAYHWLVDRKNPSAALVWARENGLGLRTFEEKRRFLEILGAQLNRNYDFERADFSHRASSGEVSNQELLAQARESSWMPEEYFGGSQSQLPSTDAGVCRDIHAFLGQLAENIGLKNVYLIQYATQSNQHVVLTYQNPEKGHEHEVVRQNYGRSTVVMAADGAKAVQFLGSDAATHYRIYEPSGKMVKDLPSELGKFLAAGNGFERASADDPLQTHASLVSVDVQAQVAETPRWRLTLGAMAGRTASDQDGVQGSVQLAHGLGTSAPTRLALGVAGVSAPRSLENPALAIPTAAVVSLHAEQRLQTALIPAGKQADLKLTTHAGLQAGIVLTDGANSSSMQAGVNASIRGGWDATLRWRSEDHSLQTRLSVGQNVALGQSDVRDLGAWGLYLDSNYVQATQSLKVSPDLSAFAEVVYVHSELSQRARVNVGLAGERFIASAFASGRLNGDDPLLEDQSLRRAGVDFGLSPISAVAIQLGIHAPLEGEVSLFNTRFMSGVKVNLPW